MANLALAASVFFLTKWLRQERAAVNPGVFREWSIWQGPGSRNRYSFQTTSPWGAMRGALIA